MPVRVWTCPDAHEGARVDLVNTGQAPVPAIAQSVNVPDSGGMASFTELVDGVPLTERPAGNWFLLDLWASGASGSGGSRSTAAGAAINGPPGAGGGAHLREFLTAADIDEMIVRYGGAVPVIIAAAVAGVPGRPTSAGDGPGTRGNAGGPSRFGDYMAFGGGSPGQGAINTNDNTASGGGGTMCPGRDGTTADNLPATGGAPGMGESFEGGFFNPPSVDAAGQGGGTGGGSQSGGFNRMGGGAQDGGGGGGTGSFAANAAGLGGRSRTGGGGSGGGGGVTATPAAVAGGDGGGHGADPAAVPIGFEQGRHGGGGLGGTAGGGDGADGADQRSLNEGGEGGGGGGGAIGTDDGGAGGAGGFPGGAGGPGGSATQGNGGPSGAGAAGRGVLRGFF